MHEVAGSGSPLRRVVAVLAMVVALPMFSFAAEAAAEADTALLFPTEDPFYRAEGSLADIAPGAVLKTRTVGLAPTGARLPVEATQVLYRTTGQLGEPAATVTTIIRPPTTSGPLRIVSYQGAYDALGARCDPSYTLRGGGSLAVADTPLFAAYLAAGFTVVTSDYEGTELAYGAGRKSGYATLDSIRAALHILDAPSSTPVGMSGFSGGSIATEYAAELAPTYAPELDIVGAALGGYPVDLVNTVSYINGKQEWATLIPYVLLGSARGFGIDLTPYLSDYGKQVVAQVADQCAADGPKFPGLRIEQLLQPQYQDYRSIPAFAPMIEQGRMGNSGTPKGPLFLGGGNSDGIGDGVIVAADERALAAEYCRRGVPVRYQEYPGADHFLSGILFTPATVPFLQARFDGLPFDNGCPSLTQ
ncbi:lipase family protein [Nocardia iowensis]|uniref:Lipase family protein n=1 Tax=Nocardia iowensis TaxID=204891 RepID=A0ABX8RR37_NOCIO|nr:lipase family protein [Nocardia iowensis]QXN92068.1 lipase family protein [Nocardia iowensis]